MDQSGYPGLRGWTPGQGGWTPGQGGGPPQGAPQVTYPGLGDPFSGAPAAYNPVQVLPPAVQTTPAAPAKGGGLGSKFNFQDIKGMVERMGGIDGILANVGKLQKIMATMQQMAPMLRLLIGKGTAGTASADGSGGVRPRRRRRSGGGSRPRKGRGKSSRAGSRRRR